MIRSMTGFGAGRSAKDGDEIDLEIRSVNHKFCEVKVRLPRELVALEIELVRAVKERLPRGAVEVSVRRARTSSTGAPRVDLQLAEEYARAFRELEKRFDLARGLTLSDLLTAAGVVSLDERTVDIESARKAALAALDEALRSLCAMRNQEGEALGRDIGARLDSIEALASRVETLVPQAALHYRDRLSDRLQELGRTIAVDPARVAQEVVLYADRSDVSEEITRLRSHVAQARALMEASEPAGRKLEFLVQEMHREANTIGSKSQNTEISTTVVGLKAEIERMREQVLNVE
jgi:uncharacterized protein (TIGR00255 family)